MTLCDAEFGGSLTRIMKDQFSAKMVKQKSTGNAQAHINYEAEIFGKKQTTETYQVASSVRY